MTERVADPDRRAFLRSSGVATLGFATWFEILPKQAAGAEGHRRPAEGFRDVAIINNDDSPREVTIEVLNDTGSDEPLYERTIGLRGLNEHGSGFDAQTRFIGSVSARAPRGEYVVRASVPEGDSAEIEVPIGPDGLPDSFGFSVYVHPVDGLRTHAAWD